MAAQSRPAFLDAVELGGRIYILPEGAFGERGMPWTQTDLHFRANLVLEASGRVIKNREGPTCGQGCQIT